ncbi:MAG TPA: chemotaxis protein CheX [candidate division Zixibacteria bacterium]|jgi:chemotaxis protein CheX|nr:chemotaxis protein CheX [candidate division Zixibacteria bacterium]
MKSEHIHPFVEAAIRVLGEVTGGKVSRGAVSLRTSVVTTQGIASLVGIFGEAEGRMLLDMSRETACRLASLMNRQDMDEDDQLVQASVNEMANIIAGRAVSDMANQGHSFNITSPTLFSGKEMNVFNTTLETVVIPLETEQGQVIINLAIRLRQ